MKKRIITGLMVLASMISSTSFAQDIYKTAANVPMVQLNNEISLAWMMNKRPPVVPIPGTRHLFRLKENIGAADIHLTEEEVKAIDTALDTMQMSEVFGGSPIKQQ